MPMFLLSALEEWRAARQDIFDHASKVSEENTARWRRLANAETALMQMAKELTRHAPPPSSPSRHPPFVA